MCDKDVFARCWGMLVIRFPNAFTGLSKEQMSATMALYFQLLGDLPNDVIEAAALQHMAEDEFLSPAKIRNAAASIVSPQITTPTIEWGNVMAEIRRVGYVGTPNFSDPQTAAVVSVLGWRNLCASDNSIADRARFIEAYNALEKRRRDDAIALPQVRALAESLRPKELSCG